MLRRLIDDCDGQDMVEYALLAVVVALGAVVALQGFQNVIYNVWNQLSGNLAGNT